MSVQTISSEQLSKYPAWKEALERFRSALEADEFKYDSIVPHEWLFEAFGLQMPDDKMPWAKAKKVQLEYMAQFVRFREAVQLEDLLYLEAERSLGYRIVPPNEQTQKAMERCSVEMSKALKAAARAVGNIRTQELSDQQKRENLDARAKISSIAGLSKRIAAPF